MEFNSTHEGFCKTMIAALLGASPIAIFMIAFYLFEIGHPSFPIPAEWLASALK